MGRAGIGFPGGLGGIRAMPLAQQLLANLGLIVLPQPMSLSKAHTAFDETGSFIEEANSKKLDALCQRLVDILVRAKD